jgi:hypothetical protein
LKKLQTLQTSEQNRLTCFLRVWSFFSHFELFFLFHFVVVVAAAQNKMAHSHAHGGGHSHDAEYPDDDWNLYSMLDPTETRALNISQPTQVLRIFKPFARRLEPEPYIVSDADGEIIITAVFTSPVTIRKLMVIGGGNDENHPAILRCYVANEVIDFGNVTEMDPIQQFMLPINKDGNVEMFTSLHRFTNIVSITFYFPVNHGETDSTVIQYIGMQGDHTHYRREPVHTMYEVLCNGQDVPQTDEADAAEHDHLH